MTKLIGILNLTPDSFSDGGFYESAEAMRAALDAMLAAGAYAVDVGAESTRPGATPVSAAEERARLQPFFDDVWPEFHERMKLSVDTRCAETAAWALARGANWINDVSGFRSPAMIEAVRGSGCGLVVMHSLSVPADPAITLPPEEDVMQALLEFFRERINTLMGYGIRPARLVLDPGIGFGKTAEQSMEIIGRVAELKALGLPILIGHSRKSFLKAFGDRDKATLDVSRRLMAAGVDYLRVHDAPAHSKFL